jgi:hypothetical protein
MVKHKTEDYKLSAVKYYLKSNANYTTGTIFSTVINIF